MATNFLSPCVAVTVAPGTGKPPNFTYPWCSAAARLRKVSKAAASRVGQECILQPVFNWPLAAEYSMGPVRCQSLVLRIVEMVVLYDANRRKTFMNGSLILVGLFGLIDENFTRAFFLFQFEPELLLAGLRTDLERNRRDAQGRHSPAFEIGCQTGVHSSLKS